jgi:ubiquinone/menaquinone biosynthesis C-methylase UbiE
MEHKFNPENRKNLFSEFRMKTLPAQRILKEAGLEADMAFADIGCGNGYFTFPASEITGKKGKVFALDISPEMLEEIRTGIKERNTANIEVIETEENNLKIKDASVDFAFSCNVMHEVKDPGVFLKEVKRIMRPGGMAAIIDWEKKQGDFGPPADHRIDKSAIAGKLKDLGFLYIKAISINDDLYRITAKK